MCKYCDGRLNPATHESSKSLFRKKFTLGILGEGDVEPVINYSPQMKSYVLNVVISGTPFYTRIQYCPKCGRKF